MTESSLLHSVAVGSILDLDPDLGTGILKADWELARHACTCELLRSSGDAWDLRQHADCDLFGLLIVQGLVCREVALSDRRMLEFLGPGDVLHPAVADASPRLGGSPTLSAVAGTVVAVLGRSFIRAAARWPSLLVAVQRRFEAQREHLAIQGLIAHLPRAQDRVLLVLWHLASRYGRVTPNGTMLPLRLGHDVIGQLAAARRSTTTLAVTALQADGYLLRLDDGLWLLTTAAQHKVTAIATATAPTATALFAETFALRQRSPEVRDASGAIPRVTPSPSDAPERHLVSIG
ncbi:MAG TPA: Crp/Fnr family transcriptional regulator [Solirubrobacteraceae bacterium]|nr:Crp/Fnr family transcriptional regulator [Solirubrobacteraceae bacterium]